VANPAAQIHGLVRSLRVRYLPRKKRPALGGRITDCRRETDLFALRDEEMRRLRATTAISMVHQDTGRALKPSIRVGEADRRSLPACKRLTRAGEGEGRRHAGTAAELEDVARVLTTISALRFPAACSSA